jgi:hypothetical protein
MSDAAKEPVSDDKLLEAFNSLKERYESLEEDHASLQRELNDLDLESERRSARRSEDKAFREMLVALLPQLVGTLMAGRADEWERHRKHEKEMLELQHTLILTLSRR